MRPQGACPQVVSAPSELESLRYRRRWFFSHAVMYARRRLTHRMYPVVVVAAAGTSVCSYAKASPATRVESPSVDTVVKM